MLLGSLGLASLLHERCCRVRPLPRLIGGLPALPHFAPKVKRVIYLFQSGGPAQMDLYDYKPGLKDKFGEEVPRSVYPDDRKTTMSSAQASFPSRRASSSFRSTAKGALGSARLLPHTAKHADQICMIRSMHTDAINHDPAITFQQTGSQIPGRPSIGAWLGYGLGSENEDLPAFVAMSSRGSGKSRPAAVRPTLGQRFFAIAASRCEVSQPGRSGIGHHGSRAVSRATCVATMLDSLSEMNELKHEQVGDPEIVARIAQYELAYRMQMSVPDLLRFLG